MWLIPVLTPSLDDSVLQIPHFEWNSMVLSTKGEQLEYLRKYLYGIQ